MPLVRRTLLAATTAALARPILVRPVLAQPAWPAGRPIEIVVPFAPGGGMDAMARTIAPFLAARLPGARVIVSNKAGAGGQVGTEAVANAAPDGFTLGACATPTVLSQPIERPVRWHPAELTWLAQVVEDPCGLFVRADSPLRDLPGLLAAARRQPGDLAYGTAGIGGDDHIAALLLEEKAGVRLNHIPFNGTSQILVPLLGGQLDVGAFNLSEALPLLRDRAIRGIALAAPERGAAAPGIPTYREGGVDLAFSAGRGLFGPPRLPEPVRTALEAALAAILADPAWAEAAARAGLILHPLVGAPYREAALGGEAALRALWERHPWKE
ncbi:tripartite tricarboxylate transporter substrate binding protein [Paeniroseomonas aquatica]|uniref:Tripartite tricarboxylate transporter substrate binding protein n=1 Tax=Paeniroseomonas aquatica TaxID=373043 RepID=A0ABT8A3D8_9PROT|nr:tripartite tricarboxylate transporter substrate binding protein [Paeniroseomonas aquatica]MDN3564201.1 tripartite tricarboxylate transporter substrate binding protein [Paeniroseomonas aquatica]